MGIANDQIRADLGIDREQLEGLCALWVMGADVGVLAASIGVKKILLQWYLLMVRKTQLDENAVDYKDPN